MWSNYKIRSFQNFINKIFERQLEYYFQIGLTRSPTFQRAFGGMLPFYFDPF